MLMAIIQYAVLNDIHFPYENKPAYKRALEIIDKFPDLRGIYLNGDIAEIESCSTHPKTPTAQKLLIKELDYTNERFDQLQKLFPKIPVTLIEGNHCYRIFRFIRDVAPCMWGMLHTPKLFRFDERGWKFAPYGPMQWVRCGVSDLWLRHEPLARTAKATAVESSVNILYGHLHIYETAMHKKMGPKPYTVRATSGGWLGDIKRDCFDYRGARDNWVNGFTRIDCDEKTGEHELRFIFL